MLSMSGTAQVDAQVSKKQSKSKLQHQKIPEGMPIRLDNRFFPNWKHQKSHF